MVANVKIMIVSRPPWFRGVQFTLAISRAAARAGVDRRRNGARRLPTVGAARRHRDVLDPAGARRRRLRRRALHRTAASRAVPLEPVPVVLHSPLPRHGRGGRTPRGTRGGDVIIPRLVQHDRAGDARADRGRRRCSSSSRAGG